MCEIDIQQMQLDYDRICNKTLAMPFGKYKGAPIDEVPKKYLRWVLKDCAINDALRNAAMGVIKKRKGR